MAQKKKKEESKKKLIAIISGICAVVVVGIIILTVALSSGSKPKKVELTVNQSASVSMLIAAVAMDKLDGSGSVSSATCETFRTLAKSYNEKTDWFKSSYCNYIIYADYNETANATTVTLSDGNHAAVYTFSSDRNQLLEYEFTDSTVKGRGLTID